MRVQVESTALAGALKLSVAAQRSPMAALQHALLSSDGDRLWVETTDCEITVRSAIPATVEEGGRALLNDALLRPVAAGSGNITLASDGKVSRGRSHYRIPALADSDIFPQLESADFRRVEVDPVALREAIQAVAYCGDDDQPRTALRAVYVVRGAVWCSDGPQLGRVAIDYNEPVTLALPIAQVRRITDALREGSQVWVAGNHGGVAGQLRVTNDDLHITVRLVASQAVDIEQAVLNGVRVPDESVVLDRAAATAALRRFMPFAQWSGAQKYANFTVVLESHRGELVMTDRAGDNRESLGHAVTTLQGDFRFGLDPKRLLAVLQAIGTTEVTIHPPSSGGPGQRVVVIQPTGVAFDQAAHVIAPFGL